jgi:hypothetical protein
MNWDALAAIAEIIASAGVIVSLVYLASQIRHQISESRLSAGHELASQINDCFSGISDNAELAEIYLRGMGDYNSLDTLEKLRFSTFFARFMRILESTYSRHMNNQLDPTIWRGWDEGLRDFYSHPGLQEWWSSRCHWFTPEFQELIVACIAEERDPTLYQSRI